MKRSVRFSLFVALIAALLITLPAAGQVLKGSISGTVTDPAGAILAGAQVKATNLSNGAVYTTTSDNSGLFRFNLIPAGGYKVEITSQGFKTAVQNNVQVNAGEDRGLGTVKLTVGGTSETVEVAASAPLIESTQAQVSSTFSGEQLNNFAGVQENQGLDNLALFVPGVTPSRDSGFSNTNGGSGFSVNGLRGRNNDQQIDGQNNNDNSVAGPSLFVSDTEFVQQYVAVTNQFGPEYGRNAGSVINIITKAGSNTWHGSIYGSENAGVLNSMTNYEKRFIKDLSGNSLTKEPHFNDQFGGFTIGGPLVKSKLFFFGGFDEELVNSLPFFHTDNLTPTPAGVAKLLGCFPANPTIATTLAQFGPYAITGGHPTPTPDPFSHQFASLNVGSCTGVQFGGVTRQVTQPVHQFNWIVKNDLQLGSDVVSARYIFNRSNFFNQDDNGAGGWLFNVPALSQAALISWTHNLSSHMVNEARVSFSRLNVEFGGNTINPAEPTADRLDQAFANIIFQAPGFLGFGPATNLPQGRIVNTWQAQDNWNWVLGKHTFKSGVNFTYQRSPNTFLPNINGAYRFSSWSTFASDTPNRIRLAQGNPILDFREYDTFLYVGDDWKIFPSLTLNLGLTWSYYGQPANLFNDITTKRESNPATAFWNPALPLSIRTFPKTETNKSDFGPSLGFAWTPQWGGFLTGHGKTTIRGGGRYAYDPPFYNIYLNISTAAPFGFLATVPSPSTHPMPAVPTGPNVRAALSAFITPGLLDPRTQNQTSIPTNFKSDRVASWSFGIQRELSKNSVFEARYVGNHADRQFQTVDGNPFIKDLKTDFPNFVTPFTSATPCPATQQVGAGAGTDVGRVNCGTGVVRNRTNTGYSNYNGLQLEFRANNLFKQLTLKTGYTWSKTLDNVSEIFSTFGAGNTSFASQNPLDFKRGEYGFSGNDYPHTWTILFSETLPFFKEQHGAIGHLLGGWSLSGNYILQSGQRYTPVQAFSAFATSCLGVPSTCTGTSNGDYYDFGWIAGFVGIDTARPFVGNLNAAPTSVGIYALDACNVFGVPNAVSCGGTTPDNQLISLTALGATCLNPATPSAACNVQNVTKDNVRFIVNGGEAQSIFGTPFGNAGRNIATDAITNIGNFAIGKRVKLTERTAFEFRATMTNVFNHPNFQSVDPFLEDAGVQLQAFGFGDPTLTNSVRRRIIFGGKLTF